MDNDQRPSIHVRTTDAVDVWLFRLEKECARRGVKFNGRKVRKEQIVNAILSIATKSDPGEFASRISEGLVDFRQHLLDMGVHQPSESQDEGEAK